MSLQHGGLLLPKSGQREFKYRNGSFKKLFFMTQPSLYVYIFILLVKYRPILAQHKIRIYKGVNSKEWGLLGPFRICLPLGLYIQGALCFHSNTASKLHILTYDFILGKPVCFAIGPTPGKGLKCLGGISKMLGVMQCQGSNSWLWVCIFLALGSQIESNSTMPGV